MSTRSAIIQKTDDGYRGIYCHHDGYLQGVGRDLISQNQYSTDESVSALIRRGYMSSISAWPDECRPYAEMDGEYTDDNAPVFGDSVAEVADQIGHNGYVYVWEDGSWTVNGEPLADAVYFDEVELYDGYREKLFEVIAPIIDDPIAIETRRKELL